MTNANAPWAEELVSRIVTRGPKLEDATFIIDNLVGGIEKVVQAAGNASLVDALKVFYHLDVQYDALDKARKRIYAILDGMDKGMLPAMFDTSGQDLARIPELGRSFYPTTKYGAKVHDKEKLYEWLRENNGGDLIQETVNSSSLSGFLKTLTLDQGIDAPSDVAELTTYRTIGSSKYTPK